MKFRRFRDKLWEKNVPQLLFYIGLTIELVMVIIDKSNYINPLEGRLFRLTFVLFLLKVLATEYTFREIGVYLFLGVVSLISYRVTGKNDVIRVVTFVAACKGLSLKQMLRYAFYVTLAGCMVIVFLAVTGIYGAASLSMDYGREFDALNRIGVEETRYTLGMGHPNALSCMFLMLTALGIYVFSGWMKWYSYLFLMLLNAGLYLLTDSKTAMLCTSALLAGTFLVTYCGRLREKKFIYLCGGALFLCCLAFSVDAAANAPRVREAMWRQTYYGDPQFEYGQQDMEIDDHVVGLLWIDEHFNGRIISLTDSEDNDGSLETWSAFSAPAHMSYYFDMGWVKLFYRYGVIPGILYCMACLLLLWRFYQKRDAFGLVIFVVLAVYTIMEAHLFSIYIGRNFLLMMMGAYMTKEETKT
ncbi:MAG: hypothetical protein NC314_02075 [Roseburia sp.]|nr:hypothetical protein [Roseburia sp.]MCM1241603.1 hypothetical protein [Roseburia sp.]